MTFNRANNVSTRLRNVVQIPLSTSSSINTLTSCPSKGSINRNLYFLKLWASVGQVDLLELGIISLSAIHASTSCSPRGRSSGITFVGTAFILIWKLVKIDITFSINGLGSGIVHTTINNHLIHAVKLFILLIHNRSCTKNPVSELLTPFKNIIGYSSLGILIHRNRVNRKQKRITRISIVSILSSGRRIGNGVSIMLIEEI